MVHFILDVVEAADTSGFSINQRGTGSKQYSPSMLLALLVYCYCTGRFSSRVIEDASYYDVAVRYLCADAHPDHDTICTFRRVNRKAFEQCYNAQAAVEVESMLIVSNHLSTCPNDKLELLPSLDAALANAFIVQDVLADTGYYSENNTNGCEARQIEPYIAVGKQSHGILIETILGTATAALLPEKATPKERMAHKLNSLEAATALSRGTAASA